MVFETGKNPTCEAGHVRCYCRYEKDKSRRCNGEVGAVRKRRIGGGQC